MQYTTVDASTQPAGSILVEMSSYAFTPTEIPTTAGKVVFYLVNTSKEAHLMALRTERPDGEAVGVERDLLLEAVGDRPLDVRRR